MQRRGSLQPPETTMKTGSQPSWATLAAAVALAVALAAPHAAAQAKCKPDCAIAASVVHAAGVPLALRQALQRLEFNGTGLAAGDAAVVQDIVRTLAALPAGTQVALSTRADAGLTGSTATRQAQARAQALEQAVRAGLKSAGAKPGVLKRVTAAR